MFAHKLPRQSARRRLGFTLIEVLVAIGILALGTVAVASLFPTAALMQREAVRETLRQHHIRSADAVLQGVGLDNQTLLNFSRLIEQEDLDDNPSNYPALTARAGIDDPAFDVFALSEVDLTVDADPDPQVETLDPGFGGAPPDMRMGSNFSDAGNFNGSHVYDTALFGREPFPLSMRSLPSRTPPSLETNPINASLPDIPSFIDREVFWVPLVRAGLEASEIFPDWNVYVFILQPDSQLRRDNNYALQTASSLGITYPGNYAFMDEPDILCANPDQAAYVPKVFRVPVEWDDANPTIATPDVNLFGRVKPGEKVLGDNGNIYRVAQINAANGAMILAEDLEFSPLNQRDLGAIWVAPAPGGINERSPLADIRLLSNTVVRTNDF